MGEAHVVFGQGRRGRDRLAGGDLRPPPEPAAAGAEDPRRCGCLARGRLRGRVRGHAAAVRVLVRRGPRGPRFRRAIPLLLLPARGDRDDGVAGGDRRPARRAEADRDARDDLREGPLHQEHHVPDHDGRLAATASLRAGAGRRARTRPPARRLAPLRFQDGHRLGKDLGRGDGHRLGPVPQAAGAGIGDVHQLPDRRAQRESSTSGSRKTSPPTGSSTSCRSSRRSGAGRSRRR